MSGIPFFKVLKPKTVEANMAKWQLMLYGGLWCHSLFFSVLEFSQWKGEKQYYMESSSWGSLQMFQARQHAAIPVDQQIFRVLSLLMEEGNVDRTGMVPALPEMLLWGRQESMLQLKTEWRAPFCGYTESSFPKCGLCVGLITQGLDPKSIQILMSTHWVLGGGGGGPDSSSLPWLDFPPWMSQCPVCSAWSRLTTWDLLWPVKLR